MVVNACTTPNILEDPHVMHGKNKGGFRPSPDFRSKDALLYKARTNNIVEGRQPPYGINIQEEWVHHIPYQATRSRSFGTKKNDYSKISKNEHTKSSTPLAKQTPTERLRSFERKKPLLNSCPITSSRVRSNDKPGSVKSILKSSDRPGSVKSRGFLDKPGSAPKNQLRSKNRDKNLITPSRGRILDLKRSLEGGGSEKKYTIEDRVKLAMTRSRDDGGAPATDTTPGRILFESSRFEAPFADHELKTKIFHASATPTLFGHVKEQTAKVRTPEEEWHETEHTRHQAKDALDPVENFRDAYKEVDAEGVISSVMIRGISEVFSDLSCSTNGNFNTIKSPHRKGPAVIHVQNNVSPQNPTTKQSFKSTLKPLAVDFNDSFSDMPKSKSTGYTGPDSPQSTGDDGDRYTIFSDTNDAFDTAARDRLNSKTPILPKKGDCCLKKKPTRPNHEDEGGISSLLKNSEMGYSRKARSGTPASDNVRIRDAAQENGIGLFGKRRSAPRNLLLPKRKLATPGLAVGESRSFVDQVEEKLNSLKEKREVEEFETAYFGKKKPIKMGIKKGEKDKRVYDETGVMDYGVSHATKSAAAKMQKEKKYVAKNLHKAGNALLGAISKGKDDHALAQKKMVASPRNIARGVMVDMLQCQDNANAAHIMKMEKNDKKFNLSQHHPSMPVERGWMGRKKNTKGQGKGLFEVHNRDFISSGGGKSGRAGSWSGKVLGLRHRVAPTSKCGNSLSNSSNDELSAGTNFTNTPPHRILKRVTTFDSAIQNGGKSTPHAQFAQVELGDDNGAIRTHAILVNKDDLEHQLLSENNYAAANFPRGLQTIDESSDLRSTSHKVVEKKKTKDDGSIDNLEITTSFAQQLEQLKCLQKPPYKIPLCARMI